VPPSEDAEALAGDLRARLRETVEPASQGLVFVPTRRLALDASVGATNFGEYFTYFSFFIVVSALLLALLFFRLGIEGRLRQIGILRAAGYTTGHVRRMLMAEAGALAIAGSVIGVAGAVAYAHLIVYALTTWWVGAVGTTLLEVHVSPISLVAGASAAWRLPSCAWRSRSAPWPDGRRARSSAPSRSSRPPGPSRPACGARAVWRRPPA
jgi:putative ABC transport system permease protein